MEINVAGVEPFCGVKGEGERVVELFAAAKVLLADPKNGDPTVVAFGYTMIIVVMLLYDVSTDDIDRAPAKLYILVV